MKILKYPIPLYIVIFVIIIFMVSRNIYAYLTKVEFDPKNFIYVGHLSDDCENLLDKEKIHTIPITFKITPLQAARALPRGCWTKLSTGIYADRTNYYFINTMFGNFIY